MKQNLLNFQKLQIIVDAIKKLKSTISNQTELWFKYCGELNAYNTKVSTFNIQHKMYVTATAFNKVVWFFLLFVALPIMGILDSASLHNFFLYLGHTLGGATGAFLASYGFVAFLFLELGVGAFIIHNKKLQDEGKASNVSIIATKILTIAMILVPMALIYTGYALDTNKTMGKYTKTLILMALSGVVHTLIFVLIEKVWSAIIYYLYYTPLSIYYSWISPEPKLNKLKPKLKENYLEYDDAFNEFSVFSIDERRGYDASLGKRERLLKEKLTNTVNDDDYDIVDAGFVEVIEIPKKSIHSNSRNSSFYNINHT